MNLAKPVSNDAVVIRCGMIGEAFKKNKPFSDQPVMPLTMDTTTTQPNHTKGPETATPMISASFARPEPWRRARRKARRSETVLSFRPAERRQSPLAHEKPAFGRVGEVKSGYALAIAAYLPSLRVSRFSSFFALSVNRFKAILIVPYWKP